MFKTWYRKKTHKQASHYYRITKAHATILLQLYGFHNLLIHNKLDPEEFYEVVHKNISDKEKQKPNFDRQSRILKKAFIKGCKNNGHYKTLEELLKLADYEAELSISIKSSQF